MNDFLIQNSFRSQWQLNLGFVYIASNDFLIQFLQFSILVKKRVFEQTPKKTPLFCLTFGSSSSFLFWPKPAGRPASFSPFFALQQVSRMFSPKPAGRPAGLGTDLTFLHLDSSSSFVFWPKPAGRRDSVFSPKPAGRPAGPAQTSPDRP